MRWKRTNCPPALIAEIEVLQREEREDDADSEEHPPWRRQFERQTEEQDLRPVEEPPDLALRFGALVLSGHDPECMGGIAIEETPQIPRTDTAGVVADKPLGSGKPVIFRHLAHSFYAYLDKSSSFLNSFRRGRRHIHPKVRHPDGLNGLQTHLRARDEKTRPATSLVPRFESRPKPGWRL